MTRKNPKPILGDILVKIAPSLGATVLREPKWGIVSQVTFKNGKRRYSRYNSVDLNSLGASEIARDKDYANFFMNHMGYKTIEGKAFCSPKWAKAIGSKDTLESAYRYATKLGLPVIVKPNSGSQGHDVALVHTQKEFIRALKKIYEGDRMALVQKYVQGRDYRIVVLDKKIISAYERVPLKVVGDGRSTIIELLEKRMRYFERTKRDVFLDTHDVRIKDKLAKHGKKFTTILKKGEEVYLLDNANLSQGGDSVDVTKTIHLSFKKLAVALTHDMGLRLCGVDIMVVGSITEKLSKYWIIEINAAPGLDHYVTTGKAQQKIVEDMYREVLKSMGK